MKRAALAFLALFLGCRSEAPRHFYRLSPTSLTHSATCWDEAGNRWTMPARKEGEPPRELVVTPTGSLWC